MKAFRRNLAILSVLLLVGCSSPNRDEWTVYHVSADGSVLSYSKETYLERFLYSAWNDGVIAWIGTPKRIWAKRVPQNPNIETAQEAFVSRLALNCFSDKMYPMEVYVHERGKWVSQYVPKEKAWVHRNSHIAIEKLFKLHCD